MLQFIRKKLISSPPKLILFGFCSIILIGTLLLMNPIATKNSDISFLDALFTATSATCITGLVVMDTGITFTIFGQVVILILISIGGLGFMSFASFFSILIGKRISYGERILLKESLNHTSLEDIIRFIKLIAIYTFTVEFIGFILFSIRFSFDMSLGTALYYGLFHSVSTFNNAGFDIMGPISGEFSSLTSYVTDPVINLTVVSLVILGGIGFVVVSDIFQNKKFKRFSLHTKVVLTSTLLLVIAGTAIIFLFEYQNQRTIGNLQLHEQILASLFQAVSPRSAGINTLNLIDLRLATLFFIILLMFIGAAPGSTGGGIKVTTFATLISALWSQIRGRKEVVLFKQKVDKDTVINALSLTAFWMIFVNISIVLLTITEEGNDFIYIFFEAISAFGTVGLSLGLTPSLSEAGKIIIIFLMIVGRIGTITLAIAIAGTKEKQMIKYPRGNIMIG